MKGALVVLFGLIALQAICNGRKQEMMKKKKGPFLGPWLNTNKKNVQKYIFNKAGKPTNVSQAILSPDSEGNAIHFSVTLHSAVRFCGAALIHPLYTVTAASCFSGEGAMTEGLLGYYSDYQPEQIFYFEILEEDISVHPDYNEETFENNIALIYIFDDYDAVNYIQTISIWPVDSTTDLTGTSAAFTGFGSASADFMVYPEGLALKTQVIQPMSYCTGYSEFSMMSDSTHYCTVNSGQASGACWQDEGGPLYIYDANGVPILIGVVGMQPHMCPATDFPSKHTRLTNYLCWLEEASDYDLSLTPAGFCPAPGASCDTKRKLAQSRFKIRNMKKQRKAKGQKKEKKE